jgi:hypothetical protein
MALKKRDRSLSMEQASAKRAKIIHCDTEVILARLDELRVQQLLLLEKVDSIEQHIERQSSKRVSSTPIEHSPTLLSQNPTLKVCYLAVKEILDASNCEFRALQCFAAVNSAALSSLKDILDRVDRFVSSSRALRSNKRSKD